MSVSMRAMRAPPRMPRGSQPRWPRMRSRAPPKMRAHPRGWRPSARGSPAGWSSDSDWRPTQARAISTCARLSTEVRTSARLSGVVRSKRFCRVPRCASARCRNSRRRWFDAWRGSVRRLRIVLDVAPDLARLLRRAEAADEMERHVNTGGDAGCGDHTAYVDEARVRTRHDSLSERQELVERAPVGRRRLPVEQSGVGVDEGARADARHQRPALFQSLEALADVLVAELRPRTTPAGVDKHVELARIVPARVGENAQALRARDGCHVVADEKEVDVVRVQEPPGSQHLPGPDEVELFGSLEDGDRDPHRPDRRIAELVSHIPAVVPVASQSGLSAGWLSQPDRPAKLGAPWADCRTSLQRPSLPGRSQYVVITQRGRKRATAIS